MKHSLHRRLTALGLVAAAAPCVAQPAAAQPHNVVNLATSATVEVAKDQLTVVFSTQREGSDAAQVQSQLKQALDAALAEARKAARPGQVEVQTGNFALYPRYSPKGGANGWTGSAELIVEGRDIPAISQLAGRIQSLTIGRVTFGLSREAREKVEADVVSQAIARWRAKAELIARQFGFTSYSLREVQVSANDGAQPVVPMMRAQASSALASDALPVEAGRANVTANVSGSVQLEK